MALRSRKSVIAGSDSLARRGAEYFQMSGTTEFVTVTSLFVVMIIFKAVNATRSPFNTDEAQHLHVVWAWARGFVQYRDLFDNHMPLFQIMFAPVYGLVGDRATILYWMRFIALPIYFVNVWCTYRIGTLLFSRRIGAWAVILVGFYPTYHFSSLQFRTDNPWALFWLLCIVQLISGPMTSRRALAAGLLLGFAFGVSMKSTLFLLSIMVSAPLAILFVGRGKLGLSRGQLAGYAAAFLVGVVLVPAAIMISFALARAWPDFRYCVFGHNIVPHFRNRPAWWIAFFPVVFPIVLYAARSIIRKTPDPVLAYRRGFVLLLCGFYVPALASFWNLITSQDFLPSHPLVFVFLSALLLAISERFFPERFGVGGIFQHFLLPSLAAGIEFFLVLAMHPFWIDAGKSESDLLRATLALTKPGDFVFDAKGEMVFRQRCFRPVLEALTLERIKRGLMVDDIAEQCIATGTCVAVLPRQWLAASLFIEQNYLPVGSGVRVAGLFLKSSPEDTRRYYFDVVIPATYKLIARNGAVTGTLDGSTYDGARFLNAGKHTFTSTSPSGEFALVWAQAVDRGFTPFLRQTLPDK